jgi:serine/threonine protein kinase/tetratricopeptide (TPR) repeat protein
MTSRSDRPTASLPSSRYELRRFLGEGGAGAVFLALDRETGEEVALKKLFRVDQRSVQRFKREFRSIANFHHPNLVKLYDLQREDDSWFLTMEYVDGTDLRTELVRDLDTRMSLRPSPANWNDSARVTRLAGAFHQLALGVHALHRAGMLHRDLKPTNVVIAKTGRVVVLDFGLVREIDAPDASVTHDGAIAGTPAYMPPEQARSQPLTPASDWYAFGAMLYEMLCGAPPIEGKTPIVLLQRKLMEDAPPLPADAAPRELADLCMALLERDPAQRPTADRIIRVLESLSAEQAESSVTSQLLTEDHTQQTDTQGGARSELFGRDGELQRLHHALDMLGEERSVIVHVRGTSGSGKTALIEHFLDELHDVPWRYGRQAVVLRSRCYERETMPFKALDGVIDALVTYLSKLDDFQLAHALPSEIHALIQVFPAFERLSVVRSLLASGRAARGDAAQIRRSAERSLRELFTNLAKRNTLLVWIDDLQWGDLDSATMIRDWLKHPAEAPIVMLLSYRSDEIQTNACLQQVVSEPAEGSSLVARLEIDLTPLDDADVERLCEERLGGRASASLVARIVAESRGNPFLALQLAALAHSKWSHGDLDFSALSVEELVLRTSALLPEPARAILNVLAVAGRPLVPQLALSAAGVRREGRAHIHELQGLRLLRTRIVDGVRLLEIYHDRVREAIHSSQSAAERVRVHERLLRVLEAHGQSDPSWLHELALGAHQHMLALRYGKLAAQIASASLAFERSAELYARCLRLTESRVELAELWNKLGLALARCRRGAEAADAYLKASELASEPERVPLLQLAASHLLRSGRYEEGERLVQRVMQALRIEVPSSNAGMYAAIAWERARAALLARTVEPKPGVPLPPDQLRRGEFYGMVAVWTAAYAPLRAALFQSRTLRMAYEYGESTQMARAMCLTATISCMSGTAAAAAKAEAQLAQAERWAEQSRDPNIRVELLSARATCAVLLGRLRDAIEPSYLADEIYETRSTFDDTGDYYHVYAVRTVRVAALQGLGRHADAMRELRELIANARDTGNLTTILQISANVTSMEQLVDQCAHSRKRLDWERERLPKGEVGFLHIMHLIGVLRAAAFTQDFEWGQRVLDELWPGFERSPVHRSAYLSYVLHVTLARFLLNRYVVRGEAGRPEARLKRCLRALSGSAPEPLRAPSRARVRARLALLHSDKHEAMQLFRESMSEHQQIGAEDEAARERYALGCLLESAEGEQEQRAAHAMLLACGVVDPEADMRGYYPELFRGPAV